MIRMNRCDKRVLERAKKKLGQQKHYKRLKMSDSFVVGTLAQMFIDEDVRIVIIKEVKRRGPRRG